MKKLLLILLFPTFLFSQTDSWINIHLQTDNYPSETSWELLNDTGAVITTNSALLPLTLHDTTIILNSGTYTINLMDSYGDGLGASQWGGVDGWFLVENSCQDTLAFVAGDFGTLYTQTLIIAPCAPPTGGCLDPLASNYDSTSAWDDGSCIYPPCAGLDTLWGETYCVGSQNKLWFHWTNMPNPSCRMLSYSKSDNPYSLGSTWYPYPSNWSNQGLIYSNQQPNTTYYFLGMLADSSYTDTVIVTTGECNVGCTDPTALNYNPWANIDDGSCQMPPSNCANGESNIVVTVIPDTYPGETSWTITNSNGTILAGDSNYITTGVPVIVETCIPDGTTIYFNLYDSFGDGMCGTCYGGVDGTVLVQTLCGDTILSILPGNANFGFDTTTTYTVAPCTPNSIPGCMDPGYIEYNPQANVNDSSCTTLIVLGCIDITSPDYDSLANTMSIIPNCNYTLVITDAAQDGWYGSWLGILQDTTVLGPYTMGPNDGASQIFTISLSSMSPVEAMFFAPGNASTTANQCGFYLIGPEGDTTLSGGTNSWTDPILQFPYRYNGVPYCGNYCTPGVVGCTDSTALNYNPLANMPDTCTPIILGCTNSLAFNYNSLANVDDSTCVPIIIGCMDSTAFNFNSIANTNDQSSCIPVIYGCMDDTMFNYNAAANTDDGSCIPIIFGCTDPNAFNYNSLANTNNGSCIPIIFGCTNPTMFNFNPNANVDDGSCIPFIYGCMDPLMFNYDPTANTDNSSCIPYIYGCTNSTMFNFDPTANTDNGSCLPYIYGCTDNTALNFNPLANTLDNSCCYIGGCTDSTAINYNPNACYDDNSCIVAIIGCTDVAAYNYNPTANVSDTTACLYDAGCYGGPGIPYWLNDGCYAWVIDVDNYCCENEWDASCQSMYDYCTLGWPTAIEDISSLGIVIYPNPTKDLIYIETRLKVEIEIYDMMGKLLLNTENTSNRIDVSNYSSGIYNMTIIYENKRYSRKIIKE